MKFSEIKKSDSESASNIQIIKNCVQLQSSIPDEHWISYIISFIQKFYENSDKTSFKLLLEEQITRQLRFFLLRDADFGSMGFIINSESENNSNQIGYYDLKFQNSGWQNKYMAFECKLMEKTADRINKYIHTPPSGNRKEDGGVYRFLTNKYSTDLSIGGMLGYVIKDDIAVIIDKTKDQLLNFEKRTNGVIYGKIADPILLNTCSHGVPNSFISEHSKFDLVRGELCTMPIKIHHFFLDFS